MLAIPVFRARVAPVLDWCSKIILIPERGADAASGLQIDVMKDMFGQMRTLREQGIETLICGALSPAMLNYGESIGLRIIHGIAGDIEEVLQAYREQKLDQPRYWLPGCRGQAKYKSSAKCTGKGKGRIASGGELDSSETSLAGKGYSPLSPGKQEGGPGGICICPKCGSKKQHERGIPCTQVRCPECNSSMTRE